MMILNFWQAQSKARKRMVSARIRRRQNRAAVKAAVERYLDWLEHSRKSAYDARRRAEAFIYDTLGDIECEALTAEMLRKWHSLVEGGAAPADGGRRSAKIRKLDHDDESIRRSRASANRVLTILKGCAQRHGVTARYRPMPHGAE